MVYTLGQHMARTAGFFQALATLPAVLGMAEWAFELLFDRYGYRDRSVYRFITAASNLLLTTLILFILAVQLHYRPTRTWTFYLESTKSALATTVWVWFLVDSIFWSVDYDGGYREPDEGARGRRIIEVGLCGFVLPILFYPTAVFAYFDKRRGELDGNEGDEEGIAPILGGGAGGAGRGESEREPLLRSAAT